MPSKDAGKEPTSMKSSIENRNVSWNVLDIPIEGTITGPADKNKDNDNENENKSYPAIVFVSGSGPTDRDWCSPLLPGRNGSANLLAGELASSGFVTLRYDKFGSGPHAKEEVPKLTGKVSMQTHADQLAGAVETLISEKHVDRSNLFVLANSEGAIHAVNYQLQATSNRFKGLVLTGAPGRAVGEVARSQILSQMEFLHNAGGTTGFFIKLVSRIKPLPDTNTTMKHYDEAIAEFIAGEPMHPDPFLPKGMKKLLLSLETPANLPFSRELWTYSPPEHLSKVNDPVLVVIGKKDIQVDWKVDGRALEDATQRSSVSFAYPENANHLLKYEANPREKLSARYVSAHYNSGKTRLDREAIDVIIGWLKAQSKG